MQATAPTGFMHLNAANLWPSFQLQNLAIDSSGALSLAAAGSGYASAGVFMGGPFQALDGNTPWYRFTLDAALPPGTHLQVFTWTAASGTPPFAPAGNAPFQGWQAAPRDTLQGVIFNPPAPNLWLGAVLRGNGSATPAVRQIRIDYGRDTYLNYLPGIYRADPASADLLARFLSLGQTALGDLRGEIAGLTRFFDPAAAPYRGNPSWFSWLSGWLAWQLDQEWTEEQAREYLAGAFRLYSLRGTVEGLRRYLKIYAGVNALISEPALTSTVWSLGTNSALGFTTMLAPGSASGAILDSTAVLDAANLMDSTDAFGSALFGDVAYRFCVEINEGELTRPGALSAVRAVLDREKPAHTVSELCIVPARMRVGAQCRIGIDSVIGGPREMQIGTRLDHAGSPPMIANPRRTRFLMPADTIQTAPERNRYFYGLMMDAERFRKDQDYFNQKRRLLNRFITGGGVVSGLGLAFDSTKNALTLSPGLAIDFAGREIVVPAPTPVDFTQLTDAQGKPTGPVAAGSAIVISLAFRERDVDPVPVLVPDCDHPEACAPSAIQENFAILIGAAQGAALFKSQAASLGTEVHAAIAGEIAGSYVAAPADPSVILGNFTLPNTLDAVTNRQFVYNNALLYELILALAETLEKMAAPVLTYVSGDNQTGSANQALPQPLVVELLDGSGNPVTTGSAPTFTVTTGGGSVGPVTSAGGGKYQATWVLGAAGPQTAKAQASQSNLAVTFHATAQ